MGQVTDILRGARDFLLDEQKWTQGKGFRDERGDGCDAEEAVSACAYGALAISATRVLGVPYRDLGLYPWEPFREAQHVLEEVAITKHRKTVVRVNDDLGYEPTLHMFDLAIKDADEKGL